MISLHLALNLYTVSAALPVDPADYFGKSTTLDQVKNKITSGSPAVYVTDVTYGRMVVAQYTTEENVDDFKLTVDLKISGNEAQLTDEQKKTLSNASFSAVVVGGDGKHTSIGSVDEINDLVSSPASLKDVKGAAMLWANMAWVDSSLHAYSYNSTEYMEKSVFVTTKIDVQVDQNAGYDLHLQVYATTYDYIDEDGNYVGLQKDVCVIDSGRLSLGEDASYDITAKHIGDVKMTLSIYSISTFFKNKTISPPPTKMIFVDSWGTLFDKNCRVTVDGNVWIEIK